MLQVQFTKSETVLVDWALLEDSGRRQSHGKSRGT